MYHLPQGPPSYATGRVALTGDTAHACLPTALMLRGGASVARWTPPA